MYEDQMQQDARIFQGNPAVNGARTIGLGLAQPRDRMPHVAVAVEQTDKNLESLWQTLMMLEERLAPVLSQVPPQGNGAQTSAPQPILPPMADRLQSQSRKVGACELKLREILDRLEI